VEVRGGAANVTAINMTGRGQPSAFDVGGGLRKGAGKRPNLNCITKPLIRCRRLAVLGGLKAFVGALGGHPPHGYDNLCQDRV